MRLVHMTDKEKAEATLKDGFRDNTSHFRSDLVEIQDGFGNDRPDAEYTGVWVSGEPWDIGYLDGDHTLLAIEIPADILPEFQWLEEGELFGKWLIPAAILNSYGPPMVGDPGTGMRTTTRWKRLVKNGRNSTLSYSTHQVTRTSDTRVAVEALT